MFDIDPGIRGAMATMADREFLLTAAYQKQQWRANRTGSHVDIVDFEKVMVRQLRKMGIPFYAHSVVRTHAEQAALFVQGTSKDSPADGTSPHMAGCAVDLVHGTRHWNLSKSEWGLIGHIGKEIAQKLGINIRWGGNFKSIYDPAHWELWDWKQLDKEF